MRTLIKFLTITLFATSSALAAPTAADLMAAGMPAEQAVIVASVYTGGAVVTNNAYIKGANAAGSANINLFKISASDDTVINSSASDDLILQLEDDANRLISFDAASDTALVMTYGDSSTTASQTFTIAGGGGSDDDDTRLNLLGGSSASTTEGGIIDVVGNDYGGANAGGYVRIYAGDTTTGDIALSIENASAGVIIQDTTSGAFWEFESDGDLSQNVTNGGSIVFNRTTKGLTMVPGTLAAAGTNQGNAAAIVDRITTVTAADGTKGVIFPSTPQAGDMYVVLNTANAILNIYPGSGDFVNGLTVNTAYAIAAYTASWCLASSASQWWCFEGAVPA